MEAVEKRLRRKNIDLKANTFRSLSVMAANHGTNLKHMIEHILDHVAEEYDDSKEYAFLSENYPEGHELLDEKGQKDFESWLGV